MIWTLDPQHTVVEFAIKHLMITFIRGRFPQVRGTLDIDPKYVEHSSVKAEVQAESIYTGNAQRDAHLRSSDFFDVLKYPTITFESTHVQVVNQDSLLVYGDLSLHGVTRSVPFRVNYTGRNQDFMTEAYRVGLVAATTIDRRAFGMTYNQVKAGVLLAGYEVHIEIHAEAILIG